MPALAAQSHASFRLESAYETAIQVAASTPRSVRWSGTTQRGKAAASRGSAQRSNRARKKIDFRSWVGASGAIRVGEPNPRGGSRNDRLPARTTALTPTRAARGPVMRAPFRPRRILISGATGTIGRALLPSLQSFHVPLRVLQHHT